MAEIVHPLDLRRRRVPAPGSAARREAAIRTVPRGTERRIRPTIHIHPPRSEQQSVHIEIEETMLEFRRSRL